MSENKLPPSQSIDKLVEFFDTHDMGAYDLPEVAFDVALGERTFLVAVNEQLLQKATALARQHKMPVEQLINAWIEEKTAQAA